MNKKVKHSMDIVFCIDGTKTMLQSIDSIKEQLCNYYDNLHKIFKETHYKISMIRFKVIVFRDYELESNEAMVESPFYEMPKEKNKFIEFVKSITAFGGHDSKANGLEALYFAMKSDFSSDINNRQLIFIITNNDAIELEKRSNCSSYPSKMVDEYDLKCTWHLMFKDVKFRRESSRLVFYTPYNTKYAEIADMLERRTYRGFNLNDYIGDIDYCELFR